MIDMSASDMSCIYSTLKFICAQAKKQSVTPIVTFDQPLYLKALLIISAEDSDVKSVVLRLGTFHLQMSFLGAVGHLMSGSGLQDVLQLVYATNAVPHILTGKAYARAVRGHLLVDAALNALITADAFQVPQILIPFHQEEGHTAPDGKEQGDPSTVTEALHLSPSEPGELADLLEENFGNEDFNAAKKLLEDILACNITVEEATGSTTLCRISQKLWQHQEHLSKGRTAGMWLQYMEMIDILRQSIKAGRMGMFELHLESVRDMLPYLAAAGHNNYTKSARLYLQEMVKLKHAHPDVCEHFCKGRHVCRRRNLF